MGKREWRVISSPQDFVTNCVTLGDLLKYFLLLFYYCKVDKLVVLFWKIKYGQAS